MYNFNLNKTVKRAHFHKLLKMLFYNYYARKVCVTHLVGLCHFRYLLGNNTRFE